MKIRVKSPHGVIEEVKVGWSWTVFFFGLFVPLIRGDIKWAAIIFVVNLILLSSTLGIGNIFANLIFAATYNKIYLKDLVNKGYEGVSENDMAVLRSKITIAT